MKFLAQNCFRTIGGTVLSGLRFGFLLTLLYSAAFALYAVVRSSLQIVAILAPGEGLFGTLVVNAFALLLPIAVFALVLGSGAALLQSITLLAVRGMALLFRDHHAPAFTAWIGFVTAFVLVGAIALTVQRSLGSYFDALWPSGYLFWLGWPSLIFVGATTWVSWRFADHLPQQQATLASAAT
ncbi:MAG: hypothetical protein DYG89_37875 [Caldilinea sp. CFX5]|nr:hypothetical protein [Caldilinea sp. CFX5]